MPNIPNLPGVPPLASYIQNNVVLLFSDLISAISPFEGPTWGIFLDGEQALPYQSVLDFDYKRDSPVSDYQTEEGGFQSYDKVQLPFDVRVRIVSGPTAVERQDLLLAVEDAADSLDLYDVVTPEKTYSSCNITHVDLARKAHSGVGILVFDIWFVEIRQTSTSTFSNTQDPTAAGQQNTGSVAPQPTTSQIEQKFGSGQIGVN